MENQPLVSVIMPCYNMEKYISDTIASVRRQTYPHWELLIVDDASTDQTINVINMFVAQDERIKLLKNGQHLGTAVSRNSAIQSAHGRFLAFLDADDIWYPNKTQNQVQYMLRNGFGFCYTAYNCIDEKGESLNRQIHTIGDVEYDTFLKNTIIGCSTVMLDTTIVDKVEVPNFRTSQDTATWLKLLKKGHIAHGLEEVLVSYRVRKISSSSNKLKASYDLWQVYRQQEKLSFGKTFACFCCYAFNAIKKRL